MMYIFKVYNIVVDSTSCRFIVRSGVFLYRKLDDGRMAETLYSRPPPPPPRTHTQKSTTQMMRGSKRMGKTRHIFEFSSSAPTPVCKRRAAVCILSANCEIHKSKDKCICVPVIQVRSAHESICLSSTVPTQMQFSFSH